MVSRARTCIHTDTRCCAHAGRHTRARIRWATRNRVYGATPPHEIDCIGLALVGSVRRRRALALQNDSEAISGGESSPGLVTYAYLLEAECELLHRTMNPFEVLLVLTMYPFEVLFVLRTVRGVPAAGG